MQNRVEINENNPKVYLAVYGTLRTGRGNWDHFLKNKSKFLGTYQTAPSYTMHTNGSYPIVVDKGETPITYELMEVEEANVVERIHGLEGCTSGIPGNPKNWYDIKRIHNDEHPDKEIYMYMMHEHPNLKIIESGNFNDN